MAAPTLTNPPVSPSVSRPATFDAEADAHLAWQATNVIEMGAVNTWIEGQTADVTDQADIAAAQAAIATTQAGIATMQAAAAAASAAAADVSEAAAAASAASALNAPGTSATSTTSLVIGSGSKSLTIQTGKLFTAGQTVVIARTSDPVTQMTAVITAHDNSTGALSGTVAAGAFSGSGTYTDWTISLSGIQGAKGDAAALSRSVRTSNVSLGVADLGKLIDITVGTVQGLDLASVIGADWDVTIKNSTANAITIDPSGSDLIAGLSYYSLAPSHTLVLQCDGTTFTVVSDSIRIERLHVLSAAASTKYALANMFPIFDMRVDSVGNPINRLMWAGSQFIATYSGNIDLLYTSPDGIVWTSRATGGSATSYVARNNGANVIAVRSDSPVARISTDGGVTWAASSGSASGNIRLGDVAAYTTSGVFASASSTQAYITSNHGSTWSALQTLPHTSTNLFAVGANFVSYNNASNTYYTSTTGLTGSWTARTLPSSIAAGTIWEDGSDGLILIPTDTSKNFWGTTDGITWTDLGFNAASYLYGGLNAATSGTFVGAPVKINGCWVVFNSATAGAGGAGALVKYAGNTWHTVYVDVGTSIGNTQPLFKLVASNGSGITLLRGSANSSAYHVNTNTTKCMAHFV